LQSFEGESPMANGTQECNRDISHCSSPAAMVVVRPPHALNGLKFGILMDAGQRRHVNLAEPCECDANVEHTTWNLRVVDVDDTCRGCIRRTLCTHSHQLEPWRRVETRLDVSLLCVSCATHCFFSRRVRTQQCLVHYCSSYSLYSGGV
jgi:hypothetical protein